MIFVNIHDNCESQSLHYPSITEDTPRGLLSVTVSTGKRMCCPSVVRDCLQKLPGPALHLHMPGFKGWPKPWLHWPG